MRRLRSALNWIVKRHPMWVVFPYGVAQALATFPSREGFVAGGVATILFLLCYVGWKLGASSVDTGSRT